MTPHEFLRAVWPAEGLYCLAFPFTPKGSDKSTYAHEVYTTINEAADAAQRRANDRDVFFCVHSMKEERVWNPNKLNKKTNEMGAYEIRKQSNMAAAKCFFIDMDVGEGDGKYAKRPDAYTALKQFCQTLDLPKPLVTSSGGGLHVYWLLSEPIPSDAWRVHATKLRRLLEHFNVKFDPSRTTDVASVLRVAGTINHKRGERNPVQVVNPGVISTPEDFIHLLDEAIAAADIRISAPKPKIVAGIEWEDNLSKDAPEVKASELVKACRQAHRFAYLKGNLSEPEWYQSICLFRHTKNGRENCHKISASYEGYTQEETDAKIDQAEHVATGWPRCATLSRVCGSKWCSGCAFEGKEGEKATPIHKALFFSEAPAPVIPQITMVGAPPVEIKIEVPWPFTRMSGGGIGINKTKKSKEGEDEKWVETILEYVDLYPVSRHVNDLMEREQQVWRLSHPREGVKEFKVDADTLYSQEKFGRVLPNLGMYPARKHVTDLQEYMISYIKELQKAADAERQNNHLGWTGDDTGFILRDKIISVDGIRPASMSPEVQSATEAFTKRGTLEDQVHLLDFYDHQFYLPHQFYIMCLLGAPLFKMTTHNGVIVNAYGETGASKSTALEVGAGFWGDPKKYIINGTQRGATHNARNLHLDIWANLPIPVDEITHMPHAEAKDLAMYISQATGRRRMTADGKLKKEQGGYRATMMMTTSNAPVHGMLSGDNKAGSAAAMRVLEISCSKVGQPHSKTEAEVFKRQVYRTYGHIGEVFLEYVVKHHDAIEKRIHNMIDKIDDLANVTGGERFQSAAGAVAVVTCEIAHDLGLAPFSADQIMNWFVTKQMAYTRDVVRESYVAPIQILQDYLQTISPNILRLRKIHTALDRDTQFQDILRQQGALLARYDVDNGAMFVLRKGFMEYCQKYGASGQQVLATLYADGVITSKNYKMSIGKGTSYDLGQSYVFVVNMFHPALKGTLPAKIENPKSAHLRIVS